MPLAIEELGLSGYATIQTVEDCGPIARGAGSVVTGRFTTSRVNVIVRLTVEELKQRTGSFWLTSVRFWGMIWLVGTIDASAVREMNL